MTQPIHASPGTNFGQEPMETKAFVGPPGGSDVGARQVPVVAEDNIIDWPEVWRAVRGSREALRAVVEAAVEEIPRLTAAIGQAVTQRDAVGLRLAAHTLKGATRCFGVSPTVELAQRLEDMGQANALDGAADVLCLLEAGAQQMTRRLAEFLQQ
jgi:HPt (histidine-containing phosphotransfer) domain-containing protein